MRASHLADLTSSTEMGMTVWRSYLLVVDLLGTSVGLKEPVDYLEELRARLCALWESCWGRQESKARTQDAQGGWDMLSTVVTDDVWGGHLAWAWYLFTFGQKGYQVSNGWWRMTIERSKDHEPKIRRRRGRIPRAVAMDRRICRMPFDLRFCQQKSKNLERISTKRLGVLSKSSVGYIRLEISIRGIRRGIPHAFHK